MSATLHSDTMIVVIRIERDSQTPRHTTVTFRAVVSGQVPRLRGAKDRVGEVLCNEANAVYGSAQNSGDSFSEPYCSPLH
jgi:hypothetical protein